MRIRSHLVVTILPGQRDAAIAAFRDRDVFAECGEAIPGFQSGRLMPGIDDPNIICVEATWRDLEACNAWTQHPTRAAQLADLSRFLSRPPETTRYALLDDHAATTATLDQHS